MEKINSELFILTYGAVVAQLVKECQDVEEVNKSLEQMGYNMGIRMVDEFLARSNAGKCHSFEETGEMLSKAAFKMFLGQPASLQNFNAEKTAFSLVLEDNPLAHFVEVRRGVVVWCCRDREQVPEDLKKLKYSNIVCGVIRGALEMVQMRVECELVRDHVWGDETTEVKVVLKEILQDQAPPGDD